MEFVFQDMFWTIFKKTILKGSVRGAFCLVISIKDKIEVEHLINFQKKIKILTKYILKFGNQKKLKIIKYLKKKA